MQNLDTVNLGIKKLGLSRDRIRHLEILDLDNKIYSRDLFLISRLSAFLKSRFSKSRWENLEISKSRNKISRLNSRDF
jgi:hypothetical protein